MIKTCTLAERISDDEDACKEMRLLYRNDNGDSLVPDAEEVPFLLYLGQVVCDAV